MDESDNSLNKSDSDDESSFDYRPTKVVVTDSITGDIDEQSDLEYDANGNLKILIFTEGSYTSTLTFSYDSQNKLKSSSSPDGSECNYSYDSDGRVSKRTSPSFETNYTYDNSGKLSNIYYHSLKQSIWGDYEHIYTYDGNKIIKRYYKRYNTSGFIDGESSIEYTFNDDDTIQHYIVYDEPSHTEYETYKFNYSDGNLKSVDLIDVGGDPDYSYLINYDSNNCITSMTQIYDETDSDFEPGRFSPDVYTFTYENVKCNSNNTIPEGSYTTLMPDNYNIISMDDPF